MFISIYLRSKWNYVSPLPLFTEAQFIMIFQFSTVRHLANLLLIKFFPRKKKSNAKYWKNNKSSLSRRGDLFHDTWCIMKYNFLVDITLIEQDLILSHFVRFQCFYLASLNSHCESENVSRRNYFAHIKRYAKRSQAIRGAWKLSRFHCSINGRSMSLTTVVLCVSLA